MARRAVVLSHPSHYPVHPPTPQWLPIGHSDQPSHSSNKAISNFDLETTRSRSWLWSKCKTIQSAQYLICFLFVSHQSGNNSWDTYFEIWPWKIKGLGHGWGQKSRSHSLPSIQPMHPLCVPNQSNQPFLRYIKWCLTLQNTSKIFKENLAKKVSYRIPPIFNQVISMTRQSYVVIDWVVLILSCRQASFCFSMPQPWPRVKVIESPPVHFPRAILSLFQIFKV